MTLFFEISVEFKRPYQTKSRERILTQVYKDGTASAQIIGTLSNRTRSGGHDGQLTFPEIMSVLLKCLPRPRLGVLHVPLVISDLDNARDLIEINLKKDNCFY